MTTGLTRSDLNPNPFEQFARWFNEAKNAGVSTPEAMALATATKDGEPSARMVLLKGFDEHGFVFYTNYDGRKGRELTENPRAALVFYWQPLGRQVRVSGTVSRVSREESEQYFHSRPIGSQISTWASHQSEVIPNREVIEQRYREIAAAYQNREIPIPPYWGGFRVEPGSFEFWVSRPDRLHDRFRYTRQPDGGWLIERLAP